MLDDRSSDKSMVNKVIVQWKQFRDNCVLPVIVIYSMQATTVLRITPPKRGKKKFCKQCKRQLLRRKFEHEISCLIRIFPNNG